MLSLLLLFQLLFFNISYGVVIDMSTGTNLVATKKWLEMGFSFVNDQSWLSITSTTSNFVDPIILIGLPDIGGSLYTEGKAISSRLRNVVKSGSVSFQVKLFQPNDSFCSKQWYVPAYLSNPVQISWTIVEKGAFNVSSNSQWSQFTIGTGLVNRSTSANQVWNIGFPSTCKVGGVSGKSCAYPNSINPNTQLGAIATIQTLVYDTYMLLRTNRIRRRDVTLVLTPHDSSTASYFNFPISETAGFMVFMTERNFSCVENIGFETKRYSYITSTKFLYSFKLKYSQTPGLFGHLITQNSVTDSTGLRSFGRNTSSSYLITQEDYCDSSDPVHTSPETASVFVIGQLSTVGNVVCGVVYSGLQTSTPTNSPTKSPAANPTIAPTRLPSTSPTISPSTSTPSITPSQSPTNSPTQVPVLSPTSWPTKLPSTLPTKSPSSPSTKGFPTLFPVRSPTSSPTRLPSTVPSRVPSLKPTKAPTFSPTTSPPFSPTSSLTRLPTKTPKTKLP